MSQKILDRDRLDEQWAAFMQSLVGKLQARLYDLNEKEGLKQKDIAERLGRNDPTYISRCLAGQKNMTLRTIHDLARAMDSRLEISFKPYEAMTPTNNRPERVAVPLEITAQPANRRRTSYTGVATSAATAT